MSERNVEDQVRQVGLTAYRSAVILLAATIALAMFAGMAFLVYRGEMTEGPLILYSGVILGYLLRTVHDVM